MLGMEGLLPFPSSDWATAAQILFLLAAGHALMDFPLQGEFLAHCKSRRHLMQLGDPALPPSSWIVCMVFHCLLHGAAVWVVTGCVLLACIEFVLHALIDILKAEGFTSFNQDQCLHLACKVAYVTIAPFID
jgi:hypothetical protein